MTDWVFAAVADQVAADLVTSLNRLAASPGIGWRRERLTGPRVRWWRVHKGRLGMQSRRYTTYWADYRGKLTDAGKRLAELRRARVIPIESADSFFEEVAERVETLGEVDRSHPVSKEIVVARLKKYLVEERYPDQAA